MRNKNYLWSVIGSSVLGGFIALGGFYLVNNSTGDTYVQNTSSPHYKLTGNHALQSALDFTLAAEVSTPAVVHITTYQKVSQRSYRGRSQRDEFFRQFFGDDYYGQQQPQQQQDTEPKEQKAGSGSGVIMADDGYIVTNNHVISGADKIEVVLNDKRRYEAQLIGTDPTTDLAVLKIEEVNLPFLDYGDSEELKIGEWVVAVGNPFDLTSTVTAGIVSAKARNINILSGKQNFAIESFIQTDAAVNPGNSGGALVNLKGELVGINTAIATPTGTFAGYSFAVPSLLVNKVVDDLIKFGEVQRALLGISIADVSATLKEEKGLESIEGVYVAGVGENSAAEEASLKEGDVILKIGDHEVNSSSELQETVALYRPGNKVKITYKRGSKVKETEVTLKNKMGNTDVVTKESSSVATVFNSEVRELTEAELSKYGVSSGVILETVGSGKFASMGIKKGFVITRINNEAVKSVSNAIDLLSNTENGILLEGLYSKNQRYTYSVR